MYSHEDTTTDTDLDVNIHIPVHTVGKIRCEIMTLVSGSARPLNYELHAVLEAVKEMDAINIWHAF